MVTPERQRVQQRQPLGAGLGDERVLARALGHRRAEEAPDEMAQRERGGPRVARGDDAVVDGEALVSGPRHRRKARTTPINARPVRGGDARVEEPGRRELPAAGGHRQQRGAGTMATPEPVREAGRRHVQRGHRARRQNHHVDVVTPGSVGVQHHAGGCLRSRTHETHAQFARVTRLHDARRDVQHVSREVGARRPHPVRQAHPEGHGWPSGHGHCPSSTWRGSALPTSYGDVRSRVF